MMSYIGIGWLGRKILKKAINFDFPRDSAFIFEKRAI